MSDFDDARQRGVTKAPLPVFPQSISRGFQHLRRFHSPFLIRVPVPQYVTLVIGVVILIVAFITLVGSFSAR
jgi:hypothetical protein